jgi:hypothetical protein
MIMLILIWEDGNPVHVTAPYKNCITIKELYPIVLAV